MRFDFCFFWERGVSDPFIIIVLLGRVTRGIVYVVAVVGDLASRCAVCGLSVFGESVVWEASIDYESNGTDDGLEILQWVLPTSFSHILSLSLYSSTCVRRAR